MKKLYQNNQMMIWKTKMSVMYFRKQNYNSGVVYLLDVMAAFRESIDIIMKDKDYFKELTLTVDEEYIMSVIGHVVQVQTSKDYILLADLLELQLMPLLISWQEIIQSKEDVISYQDVFEQNIVYLREYDEKLAKAVLAHPYPDDGYTAEPTTSGDITIKVINNLEETYLISNNDPRNASYLFADTYYNPKIQKYVLFGMELLGNANAFIDFKDAEQVEVYESDLNIIKLACRYGDMKHLQDGRIRIYYDPDYQLFAKASQGDEGEKSVVIHEASLRCIKQGKIKESFEKLFIVDSSIRNQGADMLANFISNVKQCNHYVDELEEQFKGKNVFIIAAGPSLDKNIHLLQNKPKNSIILATGTIHRKLEKLGIKPDYTIMADAQKIIMSQVDNLADYSFPMLLLSTVYRGVGKAVAGDKYLICQNDYHEAYQHAKERGYQMYRSGGSVTTIALDVSIRLGASRIVFLGADLANTNNLTHASDTSFLRVMGTEGLIPVPSIDGGIVYSTRILCMYREWIEKRLKQATDIEFVDATEGGALIKGTRICTLQEIIHEISC